MLPKEIYALAVMFILCACNSVTTPAKKGFAFHPQPGKQYAIDVLISNGVRTGTGINGDTVDFRFHLACDRSHPARQPLTLTIRQLKLIRSQDSQQLTVIMDTNRSGNRSRNAGTSTGKLQPQFYDLMKDYWNRRDSTIQNTVGESLELFTDSLGNLLMLDGYDSLIANVSRKTGYEIRDVKRTLNDFLSPAAMKDLFSQLFFYLPGHAIISKDTWVKNITRTSMAPIKYSNMIIADSMTAGDIRLSVEALISAGEEGDQYLKGTGKGSVVADRKTGFPISMTLNEQTITTTTGGEVFRTKSIRVTTIMR
jgi:hypothetical protein